ncbi:bone morphogenetic protein 7-like [Salminus brasiliensis]|uniref:bone morphogenetic protein 7-like n=1 Tax=Salminus brasiliensis TaxID=930266 RepID=UPI003B836A1F
MSLLLVMSVMLIGCPLRRAFVLQPEEPAVAQPFPAIRTSRCRAESLQSIRKVILGSLNLQAEPHVSVPGITRMREVWKGTFKTTSQSEPTQPNDAENRTSSGVPFPGNSTVLQCCKLASQIFMKDLGWDKWIIYPESFTYVQCSGCDPQADPSILHCREDSLPSSQGPCCEPTTHDAVPFLYLDETSSIVIASVPLTRECGCGPGSAGQAPTL